MSLFRSYLRVPQAVGQVKILIFSVKIIFIPMYANSFRDAGQVPIKIFRGLYRRFCQGGGRLSYTLIVHRKINVKIK